MKAEIQQPKFNEEWVKKVGKSKFISHFKAVYPELDLGIEYDKILPPVKKASKEAK